jgi:PEP-CTERM motif
MFHFQAVRTFRGLALLGAGMALSLQADVSPIDISTGVASYTIVAIPGSTNTCTASYSVDCGSPVAPGPNATVVDIPGFPLPYYPAPLGGSNWISWTPGNTTASGNLYSELAGQYEYQTTFTLPTNATSISLSGLYAADNLDYGVSLNGSAPLFASNAGGFGPAAFDFTGGFNAGLNTLDIFLYNLPQDTGNPEALDVSGSVSFLVSQTNAGSPAATPEPGFYGLLTLGLAGVGFFVRRQRKA